MKLTELLYPFAFLPVCLLLYYVLPKRCRNAVLLVASLLFFAWGTPEYLALLALAVPTLLHGLWDCLLAAGSRWAVIVFYGFVAAFFIMADVCLRRASRTDSRL